MGIASLIKKLWQAWKQGKICRLAGETTQPDPLHEPVAASRKSAAEQLSTVRKS
jgi:hypothetical protein